MVEQMEWLSPKDLNGAREIILSQNPQFAKATVTYRDNSQAEFAFHRYVEDKIIEVCKMRGIIVHNNMNLEAVGNGHECM
jgi:hypothetical protein